MIRDDQAHLLANLGGALVGWAASLYVIWGVLDWATGLRLPASMGSLVAFAYLGHRVIPRLTNPIVEAVMARRVPDAAAVLRAVKAEAA